MPSTRLTVAACAAALAALAPAPALAHSGVPGPLSAVDLPPVPGLLDGENPVVVDEQAAIVLGKALFWDPAVGSDGMACASCHFHAGADARVANALEPGSLHAGASSAGSFESLPSGAAGGPNHRLTLADFPLLRLLDPTDRSSLPAFVTDDVVSSAGSFGGDFVRVLDAHSEECSGGGDPVFQKDGVRTRRVEPRQAPSVINAVFYHRQFWDGRASNLFNGRTHQGERDARERVFVGLPGKSAKAVTLRLANASLASQALSPPLSEVEMACGGRSFPALARKLLGARPLETQEVHPEDSVLGAFRHASGLGLDTTYRALVEAAFHERFWGAAKGKFGAPLEGPPYDHMEANFSLFFGLALQLYQATLVSDRAPFDTSARDGLGVPIDLPADARRGFALFLGRAHCIECHQGPVFSAAAVPEIEPLGIGTQHVGHTLVDGPLVVDRIALANGEVALVDRGFFNTGVAPHDFDPGVGGLDTLGRPFSFAAQYAATFAKGRPLDPTLLSQLSACDFAMPFATDFGEVELVSGPISRGCANVARGSVPSKKTVKGEWPLPEHGRLRVATQAAFKVPTLRNVELTGPYMHNGAFATLEQVIDFYDRGGNFDEVRDAYLHGLMFQMALTPGEKADLLAFLRSLTDERVRWERAPFDHPALRVPDGHVESGGALVPGDGLPGRTATLAEDEILALPAVGAGGRSAGKGPLLPLEERLAP
jgi:cytochrome c peroxidase